MNKSYKDARKLFSKTNGKTEKGKEMLQLMDNFEELFESAKKIPMSERSCVAAGMCVLGLLIHEFTDKTTAMIMKEMLEDIFESDDEEDDECDGNCDECESSIEDKLKKLKEILED